MKLLARIEEIVSEAAGASREVREISYNLRPYQLDRIGLTKAVQSLAAGVEHASGIPIRVDIDDTDDVFPAEPLQRHSGGHPC